MVAVAPRPLGMSALLRPYLPRIQLEWLAAMPSTTHRVVDGSLLFADISGFTKLSERLARRHGKAGAEEIVDVIGACFGELLPLAYDEGGGLVKFGGDALLLLFVDDDHPLRAARAAAAMQAAMRRIGSVRAGADGDVRARLRMSAGVHSGPLHFFLVGDSHRELFVTGPGATAMATMEAIADAGEVVVSPDTATRLPSALVGPEKGPGRLLDLRAAVRSGPPSGPAPRPPRVGDDALLGCVPVAVRRHVLSGLHEPEHRLVTIGFVKFSGLDAVLASEGPGAIAGHLDALTARVQAAVERHGVSFLATDVDRDGGKFLLAAGAPEATGDDEARMLLAMRDIVALESPLGVRAGVNAGHVFTGDVGPAYRRTYTVMGDATNLAARVMAKAVPGQLLATEAVLTRTSMPFRLTPVEPFMVKGKSRPVVASLVGAPVVGHRSADGGEDVALVGRDAEVAVLAGALASASAGRGSYVEVVGDAGIGKSRLLAAVEARAADDGVRWLAAVCQAYESATPYFPFRSLLREALGVIDGAGATDVAARLRDVVADRAPELLPWLPLLAVPLDVAVGSTPESDQLEDRYRRERLELAVGDLLTRLLAEPTAIVVDDAHLIDEASADLLRHLADRAPARPWLVCTARRDVADTSIGATGAHATSLRLRPLDTEAATALVEAATADAPLTPHAVSVVVRRASGNPLFLHEILTAIAGGGAGVDELPGTIEALVTARIDRVSPADRAMLRELSVLGTTFPTTLADAIVSDNLADGAAWPRLREFVERDERTVRFRNAVIRDVAYAGLSFRHRRELHAEAASRILDGAGDDTESVAELLSFHFHHAECHAESWHHSIVAAEQAQVAFANAEQAIFLERAIAAARRSGVDVAALASAYELLALARTRLGSYAAADRAYRHARRLLDGDPVGDARVMLRIAWLQGYLERYANARRWVSRAVKALDGVEGSAAAAQRAQLMAGQARFSQEAGRPLAAMRWCRRAIDAMSGVASAPHLAMACEAGAEAEKILGWGHLYGGRLDEATPHLERSLALYESIDDLSGQASVLNMMGASAYWRGEWVEALALYERARDLVGRTGNAVMQAFCTNNIGEILCDQGRLDDAERLFRQAVRVWQAAGHRSRVAYAKTNLARVALRAGRYADALALYEEAKAESLDVGADGDVLESDSRIAECLLALGLWGQALALAETGLDRSRSLGDAPPQNALLHRVRGAALMWLGELDAARASLEASLAAGRVRHADYEIALTLQVMADLAEREHGERDIDLDAESRSILDRLGVVGQPAATTRSDRLRRGGR